MRRLLIVIIAAGCASSNQSVNVIPSHRTAIVAVPEARSIYAEAPTAVEESINASAADAIFAIKKTLIQLDIPITVDDPKLHAIGNSDFNKVYRIGGRPMTEYLDCGSTPNGARASTYRVYMSFITTVEPTASRLTKIKSVLVANARDVSGSSSSNRVPCGSTGKLERMLMDSVRAMVGR